jgi:amino acid transporter
MEEQAAGSARLGGRQLRFIDVISQSVGFMGPVLGAAFLTPLVAGAGAAGKGAGAATPFALLIALIGMGAIAWIVASFARRVRTAGSLYDYVTLSFGNRVGFLAGWVYYLGTLCLCVAGSVAVGGFLQDFLQQQYDVHVAYWYLDLIYCALLFAALYFGVRISTRTQLVLAGGTTLLVLIFSISIIVRGGHGGNTIEPFNPGSASQGAQGILFGILYAILMLTGFETAANLAEETANPFRAIPRAVMWSLGLVGAYFLVVTYSQSIGFGLNGQKWAQDPTPLFTLGGSGQFGNSFIGAALNALAIVDVAAVVLGNSVATTRGIFTIARDGRLPRPLAAVSRRHGTPVGAIAFVVALCVGTVVLVRATNGLFSLGPPLPEYFPTFAWLGGLGGFCLTIVYALISIGGVRRLWRLERRVVLVLMGLVGLAISVGGIFGGIYKVPSPTDKVPIAAAIWIGAGILATVGLVARGRLRPALATEAPAEPVAP